MEPHAFKTYDYQIDLTHKFTYLGYNITENLSLNSDVDKRMVEDNYNTCLVHNSSVDQTHGDDKDKDGNVQRLHHQHTGVWQLDMGHICKAGEKTSNISLAKYLPYHGHVLARQGDQRRDPDTYWPSPFSDNVGYFG